VLDAEKRSIEIDCLLSTPIRQAEFGNLTADANTGVIHKNVESPVSLRNLRDRFFPGLFVGDVQMEVFRGCASRGDLVSTGRPHGILNVSYDNSGPFLCESYRRRAANTAGAARDQRHFARQFPHEISLLRLAPHALPDLQIRQASEARSPIRCPMPVRPSVPLTNHIACNSG